MTLNYAIFTLKVIFLQAIPLRSIPVGVLASRGSLFDLHGPTAVAQRTSYNIIHYAHSLPGQYNRISVTELSKGITVGAL